MIACSKQTILHLTSVMSSEENNLSKKALSLVGQTVWCLTSQYFSFSGK